MTTPEPDEAPALERPKAVTVGLVLWGLNAIIYVGFGLLLLFQHGSFVEQFAKAQTDAKLTPDQVHAAVDFQLRLYEVIFVVFGLLAAWFSYKVWTDRRWARITLIVLAVLELIVILVLGASLYTMIATVLGLIGLIALFSPGVSAYLAAQKRA